jgi:hypothetical protein
MQRKMKTLPGNRIHLIWEYFRDRQPPIIRVLHLTILCLALNQILISNFMGFAMNGAISSRTVKYYCTWLHIGGGLTLIPLTAVFTLLVLRYRGVKYFFAYLYGDFSQLKIDFQQLSQLRLPVPRAYGVAATVQGLGMGALILVLLSGSLWFFCWINMVPWEKTAKELHETLTGLIELYALGHGTMGVLHLFYTLKKSII